MLLKLSIGLLLKRVSASLSDISLPSYCNSPQQVLVVSVMRSAIFKQKLFKPVVWLMKYGSCWRITNVILCLIWIHVLTKRCRARQRCLRLFPDHLGLGQLCLLSMRSMTTERLNLYSANDFVLARCGFVRFIALSFDVLSQPKKVPPPILTIKIPCKNDLRWDLRWLQITTHVIE